MLGIKYSHFLSLCILFFCINKVEAQQAIVSSGSSQIESEGGSISYSVGQISYSYTESLNGSISEGVQQAYLIEVVSAVDAYRKIKLECKAYPNPTTDILYLKTENLILEKLEYSIYSFSGHLLKEGIVDNSLIQIDMRQYISAMYLLKVTREGKDCITFKIVKH